MPVTTLIPLSILLSLLLSQIFWYYQYTHIITIVPAVDNAIKTIVPAVDNAIKSIVTAVDTHINIAATVVDTHINIAATVVDTHIITIVITIVNAASIPLYGYKYRCFNNLANIPGTIIHR